MTATAIAAGASGGRAALPLLLALALTGLCGAVDIFLAPSLVGSQNDVALVITTSEALDLVNFELSKSDGTVLRVQHITGGAIAPDRVRRASNTTWNGTVVVSQDLTGSAVESTVPASTDGPFVLAELIFAESVAPGEMLCVSEFQARTFDGIMVPITSITIRDCNWSPSLPSPGDNDPVIFAVTTPVSPSGNLFGLRIAANVLISSAFLSFGMPGSGIEVVKISTIEQGDALTEAGVLATTLDDEVVLLSNANALPLETLLAGPVIVIIRADPMPSFLHVGSMPCVMDTDSSKVLPLGIPADEFTLMRDGPCIPGGCEGLNIIRADELDTDVIFGTEEADCIIATDKEHVIYGLGGDDIIYGSDEADEIWGGDGTDRIFGGGGDDVIYSGQGSDVIFGEEGSDSIYATALDFVSGGGDGDTFSFSRFTPLFAMEDLFSDAGDVLREAPAPPSPPPTPACELLAQCEESFGCYLCMALFFGGASSLPTDLDSCSSGCNSTVQPTCADYEHCHSADGLNFPCSLCSPLFETQTESCGVCEAPDTCEEFSECLASLPCQTCIQITPGSETECAETIAALDDCATSPAALAPPPGVGVPQPPTDSVCESFGSCLEQVLVGDPCSACIQAIPFVTQECVDSFPACLSPPSPPAAIVGSAPPPASPDEQLPQCFSQLLCVALFGDCQFCASLYTLPGLEACDLCLSEPQTIVSTCAEFAECAEVSCDQCLPNFNTFACGTCCPNAAGSGELNADDSVDVIDGLILVDRILKGTLSSECDMLASDVTGNGQIDVADVAGLSLHAIGLQLSQNH